jgi:hypothetical protein
MQRLAFLAVPMVFVWIGSLRSDSGHLRTRVSQDLTVINMTKSRQHLVTKPQAVIGVDWHMKIKPAITID